MSDIMDSLPVREPHPDRALVLELNTVSMGDLPLVGGKNASLGEMLQQLTPKGINVPDGFATTAHAFRCFIHEGGIDQQLRDTLADLDVDDVSQLHTIGKTIRTLILQTPFPTHLNQAIAVAYAKMCDRYGPDTDVAVRSSATAEDLPDASFAGQQETYLNVHGLKGVLEACHRCFASLFTDRAISYRQIKGFDHFDVALSVGVQKMVRSDLACSGVMFSIDTETGFKDTALITAAYGLGENVVQGAVNPDEYLVFKPTLKAGFKPILKKSVGTKEIKMVYDVGGSKLTRNESVPQELREQFAITDDEILTLGRWACAIEDHYSTIRGSYTPMDIEWAKDGITGELFIVQARPETVQSQKAGNILRSYHLDESGHVLAKGRAVGEMIGQGKARVILDVGKIDQFQAGDVLVTRRTDPDWEPIMKKAAAIVTDQGGRTCFTGDTKILTNQGFMTLSDVYGRGSEGLLTLSFNLQTQEVEWKPIVDTMKRPSHVIGVSISQTGKMAHNTLRLTPDHKMINLRNGQFVKTEIQEMLAQDEMVVIAQTIPQLAKQSEKAAFIAMMQAKAEKLFGKSFTPYEKKASTGVIRGEIVTGQATAYRLYSKSIAYQVKELEENIVSLLLKGSPEVAHQFLAGVIDGDGCYANNRINIYVSEETLLQGIIVACMKINTIPQVTRNRNIYNIQIVEKLPEILSYTQRVKGEVTARTIQTHFFATRQLFDETAVGQVKLRRDQNYLFSEQLLEEMNEFESLRQGNIRMQRVIQVEDLQPAEVFNITVADHHNYVVFTEKYTPVLVCNCHAAIIAREMGIPAIVGSNNATQQIKTGQEVTVSCAEGEEGRIYDGLLPFHVDEVPLHDLPRIRTQILMNVGNPEEAFSLSAIPNDGVGLARLEFIIANHIQAHPLALLHFDELVDEWDKFKIAELTAQYADKAAFFVDKLAQGIGAIAAAFYPKPVVVRMSDFKSNEYANLLGGKQFEPQEENPMIGWRGASRYYDPKYAEGFALECQAMKKVRDDMGLTNVILMIPFCRTPNEGRRVLEEMAKHGLKRGENDLQVYVMCELPSNVILADEFAQVFDGFSIGSNDLTQLTLGLDRDSALVAHLFDERNEGVKRMVAQAIQTAKAHGRKIGICGQAPSDYPEFARFLVEQGIDSISLNPDSVLKTLLSIAETEQALT